MLEGFDVRQNKRPDWRGLPIDYLTRDRVIWKK